MSARKVAAPAKPSNSDIGLSGTACAGRSCHDAPPAIMPEPDAVDKLLVELDRNPTPQPLETAAAVTAVAAAAAATTDGATALADLPRALLGQPSDGSELPESWEEDRPNPPTPPELLE